MQMQIKRKPQRRAYPIATGRYLISIWPFEARESDCFRPAWLDICAARMLGHSGKIWAEIRDDKAVNGLRWVPFCCWPRGAQGLESVAQPLCWPYLSK